mmetsp:Transcript_142025/g.247397  ORF Transcript_142025/g.247397 Transcript_142025/m.247397 type:complete len:203 (-) Transcript_142025:88-696(-)
MTDFIFKFIIIGDSSVGKSALLLQLTENKFRLDHEATIGVEFASRMINLENQSVKLQVWDTAGLESFQALTQSYYRGAIGALLVYDISQKVSFRSLQNWLNQIRQNASEHIVIMLVGNKCDLDRREVSREEAETFAHRNGLLFIEASAKTGQGVDAAFRQTATAIYQNVRNEPDLGRHTSGVRISKTKPGSCLFSKPGPGCC